MRYPLLIAFGLIACAPPAPPQPAPYVVKLNELCQGGDAEACVSLGQIDQAAAQNRIAAAQVMGATMAANAPQIRTTPMLPVYALPSPYQMTTSPSPYMVPTHPITAGVLPY